MDEDVFAAALKAYLAAVIPAIRNEALERAAKEAAARANYRSAAAIRAMKEPTP